MARSTRTHITPDAVPSIDPNAPAKHLTKLEFGRRLNSLMLDRGWNQSELGRRAGLGRDAISTYINGRSFPQPTSLKALSDALGMHPHDLLPNTAEAAIDNDFPAFELKISTSAPKMAWVRINRALPTHIALQIAGLIGEVVNDDPAH